MSATVWLCRLRLRSATRPGSLARVAHVFAERGISIGQVLAAEEDGAPAIALTFIASPRLRDFLARRLGRMPEVVSVAIEDAAGRGVRDLAPRPDGRSGW